MDKEVNTLADIAEGDVYAIYPSRIDSMITGVEKAGVYPDGRAVLVYVDGEEETAALTAGECSELIKAAKESFFSVVSAIQGKRPR